MRENQRKDFLFLSGWEMGSCPVPGYFYVIGKSVLRHKNAPRGSPWVGREFCRRSDPPEAEKLASFFLILDKENSFYDIKTFHEIRIVI